MPISQRHSSPFLMSRFVSSHLSGYLANTSLYPYGMGASYIFDSISSFSSLLSFAVRMSWARWCLATTFSTCCCAVDTTG